MRTLLSATGVSVLILSVLICGPANAGRNASGAMLLHVNNALTYSQLQDYCNDTTYPLPSTCEGLVTGVTRDPTVESIIWMVGVFNDYSSPGVNAYQVGLAGDVAFDYFTDSSPCGPGFFEIPDATWPGAGAGTAVAYSATVNSHLFKMYWFACYAPGVGATLSTTNYYAGDHHAEWADDSTPPVTDYCDLFGAVQWGGPGSKECVPCCPASACCFRDGSCQDLPQADCGAVGGTYEGDGTSCAAFQCPQPTGACCFPDGSCQDLDLADCGAAGGTYEGEGTSCAAFQCPPLIGACCFCDYYCEMLTEADCLANDGMFFGPGTDCETVLCSPPPPGACCLGQDCQFMSGWCCDLQHGEFEGSGTVCEPNPCIPNPTQATTWGRIKSSFR